jgi:hypothetical protein
MKFTVSYVDCNRVRLIEEGLRDILRDEITPENWGDCWLELYHRIDILDDVGELIEGEL